jgi:putative FmdB family regulatory protein
MLRLFDFECTKCGWIFEKIVLSDETETPPCPKCASETKKMPPAFSINMGVGPYGYFDETLGKGISTNRQRREEMRKQGVTEKIGKGWY